MTTAEFNERLKRVNSKHKLELSFGEYHEELVKDAIMSFWQDKCGFIVEDDTIESLEGAIDEGNKIKLLQTTVFLDDIISLTTDECFDRYHCDPNFAFEAFLYPRNLLIKKKLICGTRVYEDLIKFKNFNEMIDYILITEECELFEQWSDETLEDLITDLIQLGENFSPYFPVRNYRNWETAYDTDLNYRSVFDETF